MRRQDDNPDLLEEYNHEAPPPGSDSEAEEDKKATFHEEVPTHDSAMNAVSLCCFFRGTALCFQTTFPNCMVVCVISESRRLTCFFLLM